VVSICVFEHIPIFVVQVYVKGDLSHVMNLYPSLDHPVSDWLSYIKLHQDQETNA